MDLDIWRKNFLSSRHARREGDPLYAYRLQVGEFESLERALQASLAAHPSGLAIDRMSGREGFQACFVLYAAEWWKRRYSGGSWTWKPILDSLGVPWESWSTNTRSRCVQDGLRIWGLELLERAGLRYLGSVAAQGGVPLRLLQEARGQLGSMLQRLVRLGARSSPTEADLIAWIESLADTLPRHYRQREIYELLVGVVQTTLHLAEGMSADQRSDPLAWLDAHNPGDWRQRFPVEIEDSVVRSLVESLFREAITERQTRSRRIHAATRYLVETSRPGIFRLTVDAGLPARLEVADLASLFGIPVESIPRFATIMYSAGDQSVRIEVRKFPGHSAYRVEARELQATGDAAAQAQQFELRTEKGTLGRCVLAQGERLEEDLPWIFDAQCDDALRWPLLRVGGGRFAPAEVFASLPVGARIEHAPNSHWSKIGATENGERVLFRIRGTVNIFIGAECFAISTHQGDVTSEAFEWSGARLFGLFKVPLFRGKPELYRRAMTDGMRQIRPETLGWKVLGNAPTDVPWGPVEARWPAKGEVEWRARLVVLPSTKTFSSRASYFIMGHGMQEDD